jgi:hypothetical protein
VPALNAPPPRQAVGQGSPAEGATKQNAFGVNQVRAEPSWRHQNKFDALHQILAVDDFFSLTFSV